jgi:hypothetical protein
MTGEVGGLDEPKNICFRNAGSLEFLEYGFNELQEPAR